MRLNRFIGQFELQSGKRLRITDEEQVEQIKKVLRLKKGDDLILSDGELNEAICKIENVDRGIEVLVEDVYQNKNEPKTKTTLYCAILKKENFEWVVQKAIEVGVNKIVPIITARTVKQNLNLERLRKIIREASEQSGRGLVPEIIEPVNFEEALKIVEGNELGLFFDSSGKNFENYKLKIENSPIGVWIGPEGGWTKDEIKSAQQQSFKIISLGKLTLRGETAAIIASYLTTDVNEISTIVGNSLTL